MTIPWTMSLGCAQPPPLETLKLILSIYPSNESLPLLDLSVTLSKQKGHVIPGWLNIIYETTSG